MLADFEKKRWVDPNELAPIESSIDQAGIRDVRLGGQREASWMIVQVEGGA